MNNFPPQQMFYPQNQPQFYPHMQQQQQQPHPFRYKAIDFGLWSSFAQLVMNLSQSDHLAHVIDFRNLQALITEVDRANRFQQPTESNLRIIEEILFGAALRNPKLFADATM